MNRNITLVASITGAVALLSMGVIGATEAQATPSWHPTVPTMVTGVTATGTLAPVTPMSTGVTVTAAVPPSVEATPLAAPSITGPAPLPKEEQGVPGKNSGSGNALPGM